MRKILGIAVAILLCTATGLAREQTATNTGPPNTAKLGSEIDIFGNIAEVTISASEIGVIFDQLAFSTACEIDVSTIATLMGSSETIEVGCNNLALMIVSPSTEAITIVGDSNIELYFNRVAGSDLICEIRCNNLAFFMGEVETTQPLPGAAFDSAIVVLLNPVKLSIFMENTEVEQLLKAPRPLAVIHQPRLQLPC